MHGVSVVKCLNVNNRDVETSKRPPHGKILEDIYTVLSGLITDDIQVFVREQGFCRFPRETQAIYKTVGVSDLILWQKRNATFDEISPTSIKKYMTSKGSATKEEVAAALPYYVGDHSYNSDDESDAVAVGLSWLIQEGMLKQPYIAQSKDNK